MNFRSLTTGSLNRGIRRVVGSRTRIALLLAIVGVLRADAAFAQRSLASVILPTDSVRKPTPKVASPKRSSRFARNQIENERVFAARVEKRFELKKLFREKGIEYPAAEIFLRAFKRESSMELWVRPQDSETFVLLKTYDVCALSTEPGPKRKKGDLHTPEGFYYINDFNPQSNYHLSLGVNYPNESDQILGSGNELGGDIFIHGNCKTAGCLAVTDENIKEIYWLAVEARDHGQTQIPVHIFPARLTDEALTNLAHVYEKDAELVGFWTNLKTGYDYFEQNHKLPGIEVNKRGRYTFADPAALGPDKTEGLLGSPVAAGN